MAAANSRAVECHQRCNVMEHGRCRILATAAWCNDYRRPDDAKDRQLMAQYTEVQRTDRGLSVGSAGCSHQR